MPQKSHSFGAFFFVVQIGAFSPFFFFPLLHSSSFARVKGRWPRGPPRLAHIAERTRKKQAVKCQEWMPTRREKSCKPHCCQLTSVSPPWRMRTVCPKFACQGRRLWGLLQRERPRSSLISPDIIFKRQRCEEGGEGRSLLICDT